jgi:hypothetical protein
VAETRITRTGEIGLDHLGLGELTPARAPRLGSDRPVLAFRSDTVGVNLRHRMGRLSSAG